MATKISGTIVEMIIDDEGKVLCFTPKTDDIKIEKTDYTGFTECSGEGECTSDEECEQLLPPMPPFERKCVDNGRICICQYVLP